eukprot:GHVN01075614.1.p1 GENE.GHVN01075614.1~~GHVN01075614.1.p1  ORF type:complete len:246 (+),score=25.23 GHVN01075614.1:191-928(+)
MAGLECPICFNNFTASSLGDTDRTPFVFPCGHTLCHNCLTSIQTTSTQLLCPNCKQPAHSWSKNFCLIECIERQADPTTQAKLTRGHQVTSNGSRKSNETPAKAATKQAAPKASFTTWGASHTTGVIKFVAKDRGFGFIKTDHEGDVYFRLKEAQGTVNEYDEVKFILVESLSDGQRRAVGVRQAENSSQKSSQGPLQCFCKTGDLGLLLLMIVIVTHTMGLMKVCGFMRAVLSKIGTASRRVPK